MCLSDSVYLAKLRFEFDPQYQKPNPNLYFRRGCWCPKKELPKFSAETFSEPWARCYSCDIPVPSMTHLKGEKRRFGSVLTWIGMEALSPQVGQIPHSGNSYCGPALPKWLSLMKQQVTREGKMIEEPGGLSPLYVWVFSLNLKVVGNYHWGRWDLQTEG